MAVAVDPTGAEFCIWHPAEHQGAQLVDEHGSWSRSAPYTRDPGTATAFYRAVFGLQPATALGATVVGPATLRDPQGATFSIAA